MSHESGSVAARSARSYFGRAALAALATLLTAAVAVATASPAVVTTIACVGGAATLWLLQEGLIKLGDPQRYATNRDALPPSR